MADILQKGHGPSASWLDGSNWLDAFDDGGAGGRVDWKPLAGAIERLGVLSTELTRYRGLLVNDTSGSRGITMHRKG